MKRKPYNPKPRDYLLFFLLVFFGTIFVTVVTINAEIRREKLLEAYNSQNYYIEQYERWREENELP